jgi:hypothetical protein
MSGMEGICTNCGAHYYGWALRHPRNQFCKCGGTLEISRDGVPMPSGLLGLNSRTAELLAPRFILREDLSLIKN